MKRSLNNFPFFLRPNRTAEVVAVNDPFLNPEYAAYQFKHDSVHGMYPEEVTSEGDCLIVGGKKIMFFGERNPAGA